MAIYKYTRSKVNERRIRRNTKKTRCLAVTTKGFKCKRVCIGDFCYQHNIMKEIELNIGSKIESKVRIVENKLDNRINELERKIMEVEEEIKIMKLKVIAKVENLVEEKVEKKITEVVMEVMKLKVVEEDLNEDLNEEDLVEDLNIETKNPNFLFKFMIMLGFMVTVFNFSFKGDFDFGVMNVTSVQKVDFERKFERKFEVDFVNTENTVDLIQIGYIY